MNNTLSAQEASSEGFPAVPVPTWPTWSTLVVLGVCLVHALFAWLGRPAGVLTGQDDAVYMMLGKGLRVLRYHDLFAVGTPRHGLYPPGYPALVSIWGWVTGDSFAGIVGLNIMFSTGALALSWLVFRTLLPLSVALAAVVVLSLNPFLIRAAGSVASEPAFLFFSMLAVWLASRGETRIRSAVLLASVVVFAALVRGVGVTLVAGLGLLWLLQGQWRRTMGLAGLALLVLGPWFVWIATAPTQLAGQSYVADALLGYSDRPSILSVVGGRVLHNAPVYLSTSLPWALAVPTIRGTSIDNVVIIFLLTGSLALGAWALWRRRRLEGLYLLAYFALLLAWPWAVTRFLYPLLPILLATVFVGMTAASGRFGSRRALIGPLTLSLFLAANGLFLSASHVRAATACTRGAELPHPSCVNADQASFFEAVRFIRSELPEGARILTAKGEPLWYYTGRRTISPPIAMAHGAERLLPFMEEHGVDYVLLGSLRSWEIGMMNDGLDKVCSELELVADFPPRTLLFRIRASGSGADAGDACAALAEYRRLNADRDFEAGT